MHKGYCIKPPEFLTLTAASQQDERRDNYVFGYHFTANLLSLLDFVTLNEQFKQLGKTIIHLFLKWQTFSLTSSSTLHQCICQKAARPAPRVSPPALAPPSSALPEARSVPLVLSARNHTAQNRGAFSSAWIHEELRILGQNGRLKLALNTHRPSTGGRLLLRQYGCTGGDGRSP